MKAKQGDTVKIHYTGTLDDGSTFDSSEERDPLEFTLGAGGIIPGFEKAVEGMQKGEEKTEKIPCDEAYGKRRDDLVFEVAQSQFPPDLNPEVGQRLKLTQNDGQSLPVTVTAVNDDAVQLDANHPLAGEDLTFAIRVVEIIPG